ncbi:MAG: methylenetetrahydrofolate reductase [NAD(P)H] [Oscillospiraceae bacterium]|jgi:methylenetetrahydrofolate reductase (NADPH)|nr:methylenetetrahydrofolate reductase [NAD(P)H] [Oscillospiraceae bacterium]
MKISEFYNGSGTVLSFEVFPPKKDSPVQTVYNALEEMAGLSPKPAFISVTYSAGGTGGAKESTIELASFVKNKLGIETAAHLTCLNSSADDIKQILYSLSEHNIENILALRGDRNPDIQENGSYSYASDLIKYIKHSLPNAGIMAACCPEGHPESEDIVADVRNLKKKVDAGAEVLISQMFFDNEKFYDFKERLRLADINVPVSAGIMPVTNKRQFERMIMLSGASLPSKFTRTFSRYEDKPEALADAGIAYAIDQIVDLVSNGADGIHLYTMNKPAVARKITESVRSLL